MFRKAADVDLVRLESYTSHVRDAPRSDSMRAEAVSNVKQAGWQQAGSKGSRGSKNAQRQGHNRRNSPSPSPSPQTSPVESQYTTPHRSQPGAAAHIQTLERPTVAMFYESSVCTHPTYPTKQHGKLRPAKMSGNEVATEMQCG